MKESFVDGKEGEFYDYAEVDGGSADLGDLDEKDRDTKEIYRVSQHISDMGCVDIGLDVPLVLPSCSAH